MNVKTTATIKNFCPICRSTDPNVCRSDCYNPWHRSLVVHLQNEPIGTPGGECHAACSAPIDDPPSQLAVDRDFVSCPQCLDIPTRDRSHELSDDAVDQVTPEALRVAYRALRDHHVADTTAIISRRDDITRRRDDLLVRDEQILVESQRLLASADTIMRRDEQTIDRLSAENERLSEIINFMQNYYSPIGGRSCALCVYVEGRFVRPCAVHRWDDTAGKLLASRAADPADPTTTNYLSDAELAAWMDRTDLKQAALMGTYLRLILDELRERRDAEAMFVDVDLQLQRLVDCEACADDTHGSSDEHRAILKRWRIAQSALCALARIHRGYLRSKNAPGCDPR